MFEACHVDSKMGELAQHVKEYRNSLSKDKAHVPADFDQDLNDGGASPDCGRAPPGYTTGGGLYEQFEDEFCSEDEEFGQHLLRRSKYCQQQPHDGSNSKGFSTETSFGGNPQTAGVKQVSPAPK